MLRKFHPNFQHYVKKIEAQTKNDFLIKKRVYNWKSFTFYVSNSSSCKHNGAIFYQHRNPFSFVSDIFIFIFLHGRITEEIC